MSFLGSLLGIQSAPPPPDPYATAAAQTGVNKDAAIANAEMSHVNQYNPYGSLTYQQAGTNPDGTPIYNSSTNLTALGQQNFTNQQQQDAQISNIAGNYMNTIGNTMGTQLPHTANLTTGVNGNGIGINHNVQSGPLDYSVNGGGIGVNSHVQAGNIQGGLDLSGAPAIPGGGNFSQDAQNYQNAYMGRLAPQLQRQSDALDNQLANQGITPGSQAWQTAKTEFGQQANDANNQAVMGGYQTQMGMNAQQLAANQASVANTALQGNFANAAQNQQFGQGQQNAALQNAAEQQKFGQNLQNAQLGNAAQGQQFAQGQQNAALQNQAQQQAYGQNYSNAQLNNQAIGQGLQQSLTQRELPLNEFNALRSASPVSIPNFTPAPQSNMAPANLMGMIQGNYNQQVAGVNANNAGIYGMLGTIGGAAFGAGSGAGSGAAASDIRLKNTIKRIGKTPSGINIYRYKYNGSDEMRVGVMAQEVEKIIPSAVITGSDGYKAVNYAMVR